jgi:hypothetical protein
MKNGNKILQNKFYGIFKKTDVDNGNCFGIGLTEKSALDNAKIKMEKQVVIGKNCKCIELDQVSFMYELMILHRNK